MFDGIDVLMLGKGASSSVWKTWINGSANNAPATSCIRESVDSLCRDGADAQYMQYLSKSRITSPQTL